MAAVHYQDRLAIERDDQGVGQQLRARLRAELLSQQEIPVAVHDEAGHAAGGERADRLDGLLLVEVGCIVSDPRLEQIAEDVECVGARRLVPQEIDELPRDLRALRVDVQIRDEENRH